MFVYDGLMNPHRLSVALRSKNVPLKRAWGVLFGYELRFNKLGTIPISNRMLCGPLSDCAQRQGGIEGEGGGAAKEPAIRASLR